MNACSRDASAASSSAEACSIVSDWDGRPCRPRGVSTSAETFRRTRSCPSACRTARQSLLQPVGHGLLHRVPLSGPQTSVQLGMQRLELVLDLSLGLAAVLTWSPERNWARFRSCHPDHLAAGEATLRAIYPDAGNRLALRSLYEQEGLDGWTAGEAWLFNSPPREQVRGYHGYLP